MTLATRLVSGLRAATTFVSSIGRNRHLAVEMAKREIADRYAGQLFGFVWALGHPMLQMLVYLFVFSFVFKVSLKRLDSLPFDYPIYLLAGLIPWMGFIDVLAKGSTALVSHSNLVKQVVFPLEVLPVKSVLAALLTQLVSWVVLILYCFARHGSLPPTLGLLPVLIAVQMVAMVGVVLLLSAVGVFLRDLKDLVQAFTVIGVYLVPAFYLPDMVPGLFRPLVYLNPFSYMVWCFQDVIYYARFEHPIAWLLFPLLALTVFTAGVRVFGYLRPYFGNAL